MGRSVTVAIARVYDADQLAGAQAILVDRLWPRGLSRQEAPFSVWMKDVAPSTELRKWYGHTPDRFAEFASRYRAELGDGPSHEALEDLRSRAAAEKVTLVTATTDLERSSAAVLRDLLARS